MKARCRARSLWLGVHGLEAPIRQTGTGGSSKSPAAACDVAVAALERLRSSRVHVSTSQPAESVQRGGTDDVASDAARRQV